MSADELPEREALAAELALGLLEGEERAAALRLVLSDRDFARAVADWRDALAPLFDLVPEIAPSANLWTRIEAALDGNASAAPRAGLWKGATAIAFAAAAALAGVLVLRPAPAPQIIEREAPVVAQLAAPLVSDGTASVVMARYDPAHATLRIQANALPEDDRATELWVIPADGTPRSLGVFNKSGATEVAMTPTLRAWLVDGATLAVSLEPAGGSPTGLPTGPVIASGKLVTI
jgi:anti-sigma-K factor RskA